MISVTLERVSKSFSGNQPTVKEVNLQIQAGEFFTLLGPSGCGKTTTLRMIAGFYYPTSGRVLFGDKDVTFQPPNDRNTGMVFQNYALFPHMTVFENVAFGLRLRKVSGGELKRRVEEALAQVRLNGYGDRRIDQLSGGQQQRVALARAMVIEPGILLLDEPLSNLDAKLREETRSEIRRLQQRANLTAIYVTHDQAEAMAISDRIAVMEGGYVHQVGSPQEIYHRPATRFVATFIGKSNLLEGTLVSVAETTGLVELDGGAHLTVDLTRRNASVSTTLGSRVVLAIRPEGLQIAAPGESKNVLTCQVGAWEFNGAYTEYGLTSGPHKLTAAVADRDGEVREPGQPVSLYLAPDRIYLVE